MGIEIEGEGGFTPIRLEDAKGGSAKEFGKR